MDYQKTTMIPNLVFDTHLPSLSEKELKVLLIILRQTVGWVKNGKRKDRDWISHRYFITKTGLSRKSVSQAVSLLIKKKLITAETNTKEDLRQSINRKGRVCIFYSCLLLKSNQKANPCKQMYPSHGKNVPTTKLTETKLNIPKKVNSTYPKRLTDLERYHQVLRERLGTNP